MPTSYNVVSNVVWKRIQTYLRFFFYFVEKIETLIRESVWFFVKFVPRLRSFGTSYWFVDDEMIYIGDEDSFVVTDAQPVTKYSFRLRHTTEGDESPFSNPVQVETPESGNLRSTVYCHKD